MSELQKMCCGGFYLDESLKIEDNVLSVNGGPSSEEIYVINFMKTGEEDAVMSFATDNEEKLTAIIEDYCNDKTIDNKMKLIKTLKNVCVRLTSSDYAGQQEVFKYALDWSIYIYTSGLVEVFADFDNQLDSWDSCSLGYQDGEGWMAHARMWIPPEPDPQ